MAPSDEISIRRCSWLLRQRGYHYFREDEIGQYLQLRTKRPDFLIDTPTGTRFLLEVKSFKKERILRKIEGTSTFMVGHMSTQRAVSRLVRDAARQLGDYADCQLPAVVALDNAAAFASRCSRSPVRIS